MSAILHTLTGNIASSLSRLQVIQEKITPWQNVCQEKPKLCTFINFKEFGLTPSYITMPMPLLKRKYLALSRPSNLAIRLETGRYERPRLEEHQRLCKACHDGISVENEFHIYFQCCLNEDLRRFWIRINKCSGKFS